MSGFSSHSPPNNKQVREGSRVFTIIMLRVVRRRLIPSTEHMHCVRQRVKFFMCITLYSSHSLSTILISILQTGSQDLENVNNTPESWLGSHRVTI